MDIDTANLEIEMNRGFLQILALVALDQPMYGYRMLKLFEQLGYTVEETPCILFSGGWKKTGGSEAHGRPKTIDHGSTTISRRRDARFGTPRFPGGTIRTRFFTR